MTDTPITNASTNVTPEQLGGAGPSTDLSTQGMPAGTTRVENGVAYDASGKALGPVGEAAAAPAAKPKFDPNAPIQLTGAPSQTAKPKFDPNAPIQLTGPTQQAPAEQHGWMYNEFVAPIAPVAKRLKDAILENETPGFLPYDIYHYFNPTPTPPAATDQEAEQRLKARNAVVNPVEISRERDMIDKMRADSQFEQRNAKIYTNGGEAKLVSPEKLLTPEERKQYPYAYGILRAAGGLTTQENAEIMVGTQGLGALGSVAQSPTLGILGRAVTKVPQIVSAYFAGSMAKGVVQAIPGLVDAKKQYDDALAAGDKDKAAQILQETKENAAELATNAYFTYAAAHHAATGRPEPVATYLANSAGETLQYMAEKGTEAVRNVPEAARATVAGTKSILGGTVDKLGAAIGRTNDFKTAISRASKITPKQSVAMKQKIEDTEEDLQAVFNNNPNIESPTDAANAIREHLRVEEQKLLANSGETKDSTEPVVLNAKQMLRERLDQYFSDNKGRYSGTDVEKAKQDILDHFLQRDDAGVDDQGNPVFTTRVPNLYEAENVRQGLNDLTRPQYSTNAQPTTSAFKAGAMEAANVLREFIDQSHENKGTGGVKEFRSKEAKLIDVANALEGAQDKADKMGEGSVLRSLMKKIGVPSTVIAIALGHPVSGAAIGAAVLGDQALQNFSNPNVNVQRALDIAAKNPNAKATELIDLNQPQVGAPSAPAPPAAPSINHKLYAALSSHYGKLVGSVPFDELEERFAADIQAATEKGQVTPEQKQLLQKVNEAKTDQRIQTEEQQKADIEKVAAEQQKATEKAAKEAEKQAAEQQKVQEEKQKLLDERKEAEEKEQQKTTENVKKEIADKEKEDLKAKENPEGMLDILRKPKPAGRQSLIGKLTRVVHGPEESFADQRLQRTPAKALYGHSDESAMGHEWGHVARSAMEGLKSGDISSHLHTDSQPTTVGGTQAFGGVERVSRPLVENEDVVSKYTPEQVVENARKHVRANMAGAVVNELIHGIPIDANAGLHTDMAQSRQWLTDSGLTDEQAEVEIQNVINKVREDFQKHPEILDATRENSHVRERGLDSTLHASKERVKNFEQHVKEIIDANENDGHDGPSNRGNKKESDAGIQGKDSEVGGEATRGKSKGQVRAEIGQAQQQGGHAGGGVASEEELARPGRFVKVSRSGAATDQNKVPDFNLRPGEAGYQVTKEGPKLVAGEESPSTKRGAEAYHKEVFGQRANLRGAPPEKTTGSPETDEAIKAGGGVPGGTLKADESIGLKELSLFHDPTTGTTLALKTGEVTPERVAEKLRESRAEYAKYAKPEDKE